MARLVDLDDIIDSAGVAEHLGLSHSNSVGTYRSRYADFPPPVLDLGSGRCLLWLRSDIEKWANGRPPRPSARPSNQADGQT